MSFDCIGQILNGLKWIKQKIKIKYIWFECNIAKKSLTFSHQPAFDGLPN